jgi:hypothetical protein
MALLQVLKVTVPGSGTGAAATAAKDYYFQGGLVYSDSAVATATGISVVADFENDEPLCSIEQLILSKKIMRLTAEIETAVVVNGKKVRKTGTLYVARTKAADVLGNNSLNGKPFTVKNGTTTKSLGTIQDVRTSTRDSFN